MKRSTFSTTAQAAIRFHIQPASMRSAYCRNGNYSGIKPVKLPNGRLLWPDDEIDNLLFGGEK